MAELLGLVASVIQVAGAGIQLSKTLYDYVDGVATADRRIKDIATEIRMTSIVIEELGDVFKHEETASLVSKKAVKTANDTITECSALFAQIDATLKKSKKNTFGRLMLPFRDTKLELLRSHVDKLKSTLQLLMQVLTHAYQVASRKLDRAAEERQREEIKKLLGKKDESTRKHEELLRRDSASKSSTLVEEGEEAPAEKDRELVMAASAIGSTVTTQSLAACVDKVRDLLQNIESLQQALASARPGDDHSSHHQGVVASYFLTRAHLDQVLLGSSKEADILQPKTLNSTGFNLNLREMSFPSHPVDVKLGSLSDLDLGEDSMGMDMNMDMDMDMNMNMEGGGDNDWGLDFDNMGGDGEYTPTSPAFAPTSPNHVPTSPYYSPTSPTLPTHDAESEDEVVPNAQTLDHDTSAPKSGLNARFKNLVGSARKSSCRLSSSVPTGLTPEGSVINDDTADAIRIILERGQKLDYLQEKSDALSAPPKTFYTSSNKQNTNWFGNRLASFSGSSSATPRYQESAEVIDFEKTESEHAKTDEDEIKSSDVDLADNEACGQDHPASTSDKVASDDSSYIEMMEGLAGGESSKESRKASQVVVTAGERIQGEADAEGEADTISNQSAYKEEGTISILGDPKAAFDVLEMSPVARSRSPDNDEEVECEKDPLADDERGSHETVPYIRWNGAGTAQVSDAQVDQILKDWTNVFD